MLHMSDFIIWCIHFILLRALRGAEGCHMSQKGCLGKSIWCATQIQESTKRQTEKGLGKKTANSDGDGDDDEITDVTPDGHKEEKKDIPSPQTLPCSPATELHEGHVPLAEQLLNLHDVARRTEQVEQDLRRRLPASCFGSDRRLAFIPPRCKALSGVSSQPE